MGLCTSEEQKLKIEETKRLQAIDTMGHQIARLDGLITIENQKLRQFEAHLESMKVEQNDSIPTKNEEIETYRKSQINPLKLYLKSLQDQKIGIANEVVAMKTKMRQSETQLVRIKANSILAK